MINFIAGCVVTAFVWVFLIFTAIAPSARHDGYTQAVDSMLNRPPRIVYLDGQAPPDTCIMVVKYEFDSIKVPFNIGTDSTKSIRLLFVPK